MVSETWGTEGNNRGVWAGNVCVFWLWDGVVSENQEWFSVWILFFGGFVIDLMWTEIDLFGDGESIVLFKKLNRTY